MQVKTRTNKSPERLNAEKVIDGLSDMQFKNLIRWFMDLEPLVEKGSVKHNDEEAA